MITGVSSSEQSSLLTHNGRDSQWSQVSSGIWVPKTPRSAQHQSSQPYQDGTQPVTEEAYPDRPDSADHEGWKRYWAERGWIWRREPEIALARQKELAELRATPVDMGQSVYPFRGMSLTRADIEWLLATHDDGRGPVDWSDQSQRERKGLDLRGANLKGKELNGLPLARLQGTLSWKESLDATSEQLKQAMASLEDIQLRETHLEGAILDWAHLKNAFLMKTHLEDAHLWGADLSGADLRFAHLEGAQLTGADLENAFLSHMHLEGAILYSAKGERVTIQDGHLEGVRLVDAKLPGVNLLGTRLSGANLAGANLSGAILSMTDLKGANLAGTNLSGVDLSETDLKGANLAGTNLSGADLSGVALADKKAIGPVLVDVHWGETNLSVVDWSYVQMLGDEYQARLRVDADGQRKKLSKRRRDYHKAHRANHQLAVALQNQGLVDDATRFAYRAKCLKRTVFWYDLLLAQTMRQRFQISWPLLFSWALFLLAGYGYRLRRCLFWYVGIVVAFMLLYWWLDPVQLPWWIALGESVNVFHGRGAAPTIAQLAHPVWFTLLTVVEALIGLVIEVVFVATMIQRLFGK